VGTRAQTTRVGVVHTLSIIRFRASARLCGCCCAVARICISRIGYQIKSIAWELDYSECRKPMVMMIFQFPGQQGPPFFRYESFTVALDLTLNGLLGHTVEEM
jgi:hypothetical protein